jgi:hypothetical protein
MTFHYDFILKTIQGSTEPMKWLEIMKQSYWFQQRQVDIKECLAEKESYQKQMNGIEVTPYFSECKQRCELEKKLKTHANKKEIQRELTSLKNKHLGPKWTAAWTDYLAYEKMITRCIQLDDQVRILEDYESVVRNYITFLYHQGYLTSDDPYLVTNQHLTSKGILATEVNEGHPLIMAELYYSKALHNLSGEDLITVLACFHEKNITIPVSQLDVSQESYDCLLLIERMTNEYYRLDKSDYWTISTEMIEPISQWIHGTPTSVICNDYELFEGNMMRSLLKISAILEEWLTMAIYSQHTDQIEKIMELKKRMEITQADSLYLRL